MDSNIHLGSLISRHDDEATRTSTSEGLEEGEVEGETLLIVESEDQASVDLSHDQSGDSLNSDEGDVSWMEEQLSYFCDKCQKWIPATSKPTLDPIITVEGLRKRASRNPVESAMELKEKRCRTQEAKDIRRAQKEAAGFLDRSTSSTPVKFISRGRRPDVILEKGEVIDFSSLSSSDRTPLTSPSPSPSLDFSAPGTPASHSATPSLLSEADLIPDVMPPQALFHDDDELEGDGVIDPGMEYVPPPAGPAASGTVPGGRKKVRVPAHIKQEEESEEEKPDRMDIDSEDTDSNTSLQTRAREKRKPQLEKDRKPKGPKYTPVSIYEEKLLLKRLEACPSAVAMTPEARRLKRKLIVRQAKRDRGLPLFDLDQVVNAALLLVDGIYGAKEGVSRLPAGQATYRTTCQDFRILDRYQTALPSRKGFRHQTTKFLYRLVGSEDLAVDQSIISPYTSRILKPYIRRRDYETKPPKLQLLSQIRSHLHRNDPHWMPEPDAPLDYCYVRPNHIPTINSMCQEFFWPGIDLSECLQYPDFSVVVLYKKVIIAFGFMVPDVKYNEAYISFLFVHPEWRRAGIATFMIYHLIQREKRILSMPSVSSVLTNASGDVLISGKVSFGFQLLPGVAKSQLQSLTSLVSKTIYLLLEEFLHLLISLGRSPFHLVFFRSLDRPAWARMSLCTSQQATQQCCCTRSLDSRLRNMF
ncbi:cysteine-rich protein 2-binding protein isoform X7 [Myotis myotis]|uniref:cysteine-rich protein 2-binding protein isoform X7 n=1 Tax=Myotis myotis TaxID=51298 RepID=UPI00174A7E98|nr:cysteine-rich protein 2-binding protein isoform X7 [Myotis myotis]